jgi:hypothetical protein
LAPADFISSSSKETTQMGKEVKAVLVSKEDFISVNWDLHSEDTPLGNTTTDLEELKVIFSCSNLFLILFKGKK